MRQGRHSEKVSDAVKSMLGLTYYYLVDNSRAPHIDPMDKA